MKEQGLGYSLQQEGCPLADDASERQAIAGSWVRSSGHTGPADAGIAQAAWRFGDLGQRAEEAVEWAPASGASAALQDLEWQAENEASCVRCIG